MLAAEYERHGHEVLIYDYNFWGKQFAEFRRMAGRVHAVHFIGAVGLRKIWHAWILRYKMKTTVLVHIVGSEVFRYRKIGVLDKWMWISALKQAHRVFAVAPWLTREWKNKVPVETFPVFFKNYRKTRTQTPEKFTVLVYLPQSRPEFYGADIVRKLIKAQPQMHFLILGKNPCSRPRSNLTVRAIDFERDMDAVYNESSVLLRLTEHDGLSNMVLEALANDLPVIWTHRLPHVITVERRYDAVETALMKIQNQPQPVNSSEWTQKQFNLNRLAEQLFAFYEQPDKTLPADIDYV